MPLPSAPIPRRPQPIRAPISESTSAASPPEPGVSPVWERDESFDDLMGFDESGAPAPAARWEDDAEEEDPEDGTSLEADPGDANEVMEFPGEVESAGSPGPAAQRPYLLPKQALPTRPLLGGKPDLVKRAAKQYQSVGDLTAQDLLTRDFDEWIHLEPKIKEITDWVQATLSEQKQTELVAKARSERGELYQDMIQTLDRMILQHVASDRTILQNEKQYLVARVINEVLGLGPIEPLWRDPSITEIMVDGPMKVRIERGGKILTVPGARFRNAEHLLSLCQAILAPINRSLDIANPLEDGRLPDKSRVNAVHPAVGPNGPYLTIRRHKEEAWSMQELVSKGAMSDEIATELGWLIHSGCTTTVVGGTGSGKTTMLNALSAAIPRDARVITIEDNLELQLSKNRLVVSMEARPPSAAGKSAVTIRDLVRNSLRMRPDRIVVGEVRDASAYDMLQAANTGHDGSMTTYHANGAFEAIPRLESMVAQAGEVGENGIKALICSALDLIVVVRRFPEDGSRRLSGIYEVPNEPDDKGNVHPVPLWEFVHEETVEGQVIGHYEKKNEFSEELARKHSLRQRRRFTTEEVYEMTDL